VIIPQIAVPSGLEWHPWEQTPYFCVQVLLAKALIENQLLDTAWWNQMVENKIKAVRTLFSLELKNDELAFLFLGYSGILLRSEDMAITIDPGRSLTHTEAFAIKHLDLLLFTHNHWDHFRIDHALEIFEQTQPQVVADIVSYEELKAHVPPNMLTKADPASKCATHQLGEIQVTALQGIHVGPITQYLIDLGKMRIFHGGDSGYWRQRNTSADIAFVPVGTATTCSPAVALATIMDLSPRIAVPIHGRRQEMRRFGDIMGKLCPEVKVLVPEKSRPTRLAVDRTH
jgi:L-ascorbate metabolism protein UlaG (beta-lactamase superfamily)